MMLDDAAGHVEELRRLTLELRQDFLEHLADEHGVRFTAIGDTAHPPEAPLEQEVNRGAG